MPRQADPNAVRLAVILGTNEIASAVGVYLHRAGYCVVLSHDPNPPVMRRKMAFHDALFADFARVENVIGERVDDTMDIFKALRAPRHLLVTWLGLLDLLPIRPIDVLIDARMQKRAQRHIPTDSTKAVEISDPHSLVLMRFPHPLQ